MKNCLAFALMLGLLPGTLLSAAEWGDLRLKFVYDGAAPSPSPVNADKDAAFCGRFELVYENLVVNQENGGIANVIAYLPRPRTGAVPAVHPDFAETASAKVVLDNSQCRFEPHVVMLRTTQTLVVKNTDTVGHNTNSSTASNPPQNILIPSGGQVEQKLTQAERLPAKVACNIHPWMVGWLVVQDNPYMAVSDKNGQLVIKNLPVGKWTFQFWHEAGGYVAKVKQGGKPTEWNRGRLDVTIKPGMNDLGEVKYKP